MWQPRGNLILFQKGKHNLSGSVGSMMVVNESTKNGKTKRPKDIGKQ